MTTLGKCILLTSNILYAYKNKWYPNINISNVKMITWLATLPKKMNSHLEPNAKGLI